MATGTPLQVCLVFIFKCLVDGVVLIWSIREGARSFAFGV
uniref:Uncharacterized protein n=1 Tax=Setaria italica TaxID=4555 RepID=K3ZPQ6_SETIT